MFKVASFSSIKFTRKDAADYSLISKDGSAVDLYWGSIVRGIGGYKHEAGVFSTYGHPVTGGGTAFFEMKSLFTGGTLYVNKDGGFGTLEFGNNSVTLSGSIYVALRVDGSSPAGNPSGTQINLSGGATLTIDNTGAQKPRLNVTTVNAAPPVGWSFSLFNTPTLVGMFEVAQISYDGPFAPVGGYTATDVAGPPRQIRITR